MDSHDQLLHGLFDEETNNTNDKSHPSILFSIDKSSTLANIECLPNGFNRNGKRSPSNTTHNVFVSDQLKIHLKDTKLMEENTTLVCQLVINETVHTEKTFNELHECTITIPRCNKGGSQGKSRVGFFKLFLQKQGEPSKLVGMSNNFWIRTKTRKEAVTTEKKVGTDDRKLKREYEHDSEGSSSSDTAKTNNTNVKKRKSSMPIINTTETTSVAIFDNHLVEENLELKKRVAELEKLVSDILTGKVNVGSNDEQQPASTNFQELISKPSSPISRPPPIIVPLSQVPGGVFGMCSPTMMTSSCSSPKCSLSPTTSFFLSSPPRYDNSFEYGTWDEMSDFF